MVIGLVELRLGQEDGIVWFGVGLVRDASGLGDVPEAGEAHPDAHAGLDGSTFGVDCKGEGGGVHDSDETHDPRVQGTRRAQIEQ